MISIVRSPARVSWWVMFNGIILETTDTRYEALERAHIYQNKVG